MNVGEYEGNDGLRYRWEHRIPPNNSADGYDHQVLVGKEWKSEWIDPDDVNIAKVALDALIASETGDWVYWTTKNGYTYRATRDGSAVQYRCSDDPDGDQTADWYAAVDEDEAYRKGREVALEEVARTVKLDSEAGTDACSGCIHTDLDTIALPCRMCSRVSYYTLRRDYYCGDDDDE